MANIPIISNADQPVPGEPGGGTNSGTVTWLDSAFIDFYTGWDQANVIYTRFIEQAIPLGERLLWMHQFTNPGGTPYTTFNQAAYSITSNTGQGPILEKQNLSVMAPQEMDWGSGRGSAKLWNSGKGTKLLIAAGSSTNGTNPVSLVSISVNSQFIESSISKAQTIAVGNFMPNQNTAWAEGISIGVSPNGNHIAARLTTYQNASARGYGLFKVNFDSEHYLTGYTRLANPNASVTSAELNYIVALSNTHIYTMRTTYSYKWYLDKRDINTGMVVASISDSSWTTASGSYMYIPSSRNPGKVFGNHLYIFTAGTFSGNTTKDQGRIWKINLDTDQIVKYWNVSQPPIDPNFQPPYYQEPYNVGYSELNHFDIDDEGTVYLYYNADYIEGSPASWNSNTRTYRLRVHKAKLN